MSGEGSMHDWPGVYLADQIHDLAERKLSRLRDSRTAGKA